MRQYLGILICVGCMGQAGCALMDGTREMTKGMYNVFRPKPGNYGEDILPEDDHQDAWDSVGKEGRAGKARQKESDGLSKYLQSPQARDIERSVGID